MYKKNHVLSLVKWVSSFLFGNGGGGWWCCTFSYSPELNLFGKGRSVSSLLLLLPFKWFGNDGWWRFWLIAKCKSFKKAWLTIGLLLDCCCCCCWFGMIWILPLAEGDLEWMEPLGGKWTILLALSNLAGLGGTAGEDALGLGAMLGLGEVLEPDPLLEFRPVDLGGLLGMGHDVCLNTGLPAAMGVLLDCTGEELCLVSDWHFLKVSS